jgi:hypothetical protein
MFLQLHLHPARGGGKVPGSEIALMSCSAAGKLSGDNPELFRTIQTLRFFCCNSVNQEKIRFGSVGASFCFTDAGGVIEPARLRYRQGLGRSKAGIFLSKSSGMMAAGP